MKRLLALARFTPRSLRFSFAPFAWTFLLLLFATPARAHVGSKDVFETLRVGPYQLNVTIRMPNVIPGIAMVEVETDGTSPDLLEITPTPLTGEASKHPPTADAMTRDSADPNHYTGQLWIMARGSWEVRFHATGAAGTGDGAVPVAAVPLSVLPMSPGLGWLLAALGLVLMLGFAGLVSAAVRESRLAPGLTPDPARQRRARVAFAVSFLFAIGIVALGAKWWHSEAIGYASEIYKPTEMKISGVPQKDSNGAIDFDLGHIDAKTGEWKQLDYSKLLLDHGKVMHLYAIRWPQMDAVFHLHPERYDTGLISLTLPNMPAGNYKLFADIVQPSGFPETLTNTLTIPEALTQTPLADDDASAMPPPLSAGLLPTAYKLPDGYTMRWDPPPALTAARAYKFHFTLLAPNGQPATDVVPYLGMAGHAAFVKTDGTVFAHTHPDGSAAMPAMEMANGGDMSGMAGMEAETPAHSAAETPAHSAATIPAWVDFPYGFPSAGRYRIFVQMKHGTTVETGVFDAEVK